LNDLQDELNKARIRLRRSEDFELKYDIIMKSNSNFMVDLELKEKEISRLKCELESQVSRQQ
jgi:hypothetical protein